MTGPSPLPSLPDPPERPDLERHFASAASWAHDRQAAVRASARTAWIVAAFATAVALLEAVALALLTPLKTVEPLTLLVDRHTGYVQALNPLQPGQMGASEALTQSFLVQYVIAREGFDHGTVQSDYRKVSLWSAGAARSDYLALMDADNPNGPLALYPSGGTIQTTVVSVSMLDVGTAMVRFRTRERDEGGDALTEQAWVAIVAFRYSGEPMSIEDRMVNPLGFQVIRYRRDPEALPTFSPTPADPDGAPSDDSLVDEAATTPSEASP